MVYARSSYDRVDLTLSSRALGNFSGGQEWLTPVVLRTPSVNHSCPLMCVLCYYFS